MNQNDPNTAFSFEAAVEAALQLGQSESDGWTYNVTAEPGSELYLVEVRDGDGNVAGYWGARS